MPQAMLLLLVMFALSQAAWAAAPSTAPSTAPTTRPFDGFVLDYTTPVDPAPLVQPPPDLEHGPSHQPERHREPTSALGTRRTRVAFTRRAGYG